MKKNKINLIKKYNLNVPSWTLLLLNLNNSINTKKLIKYNTKTLNGFFVSHNADEITDVKKVLKNLNLTIAHLYINIIPSSEGFGRHKDNVDVWFWQCQGISKWMFDENKEYILEPGDLIYVSKGIYHNVVSLTPRAGISMSF